MKRMNPKRYGVLIILMLGCLGMLINRAEAAQTKAAQPKAYQAKASGMGFSLKVSGGMGFFIGGGGDLENLRLAKINYYRDLKQDPRYTKAWTNWKKLSQAPNYEVDLLFHLNKNIAIGVGAGYLSVNSKGDFGYNWVEEGTSWFGPYTIEDNISYRREYKITATSIRLGLYLFFPSGAFNVYAYAGGGYYYGKLTHKFGWDDTYLVSTYSYVDEKDEITELDDVSEEAKKNAFGFHGGLGLEVKLMSHAALGVEVFGRFVDFGGWRGSFKETFTQRERRWDESEGWYSDETTQESFNESGPLWYYEEYSMDLNKYYGQMFVWQTKPEGLDFQNVREAKINLNAWGVAVSLRIFFNF
jgi:hypothetical protein